MRLGRSDLSDGSDGSDGSVAVGCRWWFLSGFGGVGGVIFWGGGVFGAFFRVFLRIICVFLKKYLNSRAAFADLSFGWRATGASAA